MFLIVHRGCWGEPPIGFPLVSLPTLVCSHEHWIGVFYCKEMPSHPKRDVDQTDQGWHLDQRAYDTNERFTRVQAEDCDRYGNRQLEVVTGSSEGERGRLCIVRAEPLAHPKADQKHDEEVDD